jgi:hypothetical protein
MTTTTTQDTNQIFLLNATIARLRHARKHDLADVHYICTLISDAAWQLDEDGGLFAAADCLMDSINEFIKEHHAQWGGRANNKSLTKYATTICQLRGFDDTHANRLAVRTEFCVALRMSILQAVNLDTLLARYLTAMAALQDSN